MADLPADGVIKLVLTLNSLLLKPLEDKMEGNNTECNESRSRTRPLDMKQTIEKQINICFVPFVAQRVINLTAINIRNFMLLYHTKLL